MDDIDPFKISALVPNFQAQIDGYKAASAETRRRLRGRLDLSYGGTPRQRLDLFFPEGRESPKPIHVFIHGGYWRAQAKADYSFIANGIVAAGAIAAIVDYRLLPRSRLADLVGDVRAAVRWLVDHSDEFDGDARRLSATGHSAGAHLCSYLACRAPHEPAMPQPTIRSLLLVSGIYDLHPIASSFLQPELHLTGDETDRWSPVLGLPDVEARFTLAVGENETKPFHQQAQTYARRLEECGAEARYIGAANHEHMSVVRDVGIPASEMGKLLAETIARAG